MASAAANISTPQRRSARLSNQVTASEGRPSVVANAVTPSRLPKSPLAKLLEREDTPDSGRHGRRGIVANLDAIASPLPKMTIAPVSSDARVDGTPKRTSSKNGSLLKTPATADKPRPESEDMHPSFFHSAVKAKKADEHPVENNGGTPASSPTKKISSPAQGPATPATEFNFKFASSSRRVGSTELSSEAQKMMDQVREQAARIKQELSEQSAEQSQRSDVVGVAAVLGRKIATPKGRFSDIHNANFKKMDSIANHASTFRADPLKNNPIPASTPTKTKSLKRTQSKASLAERESTEDAPPSASPAKRIKSDAHTGGTPTATAIASVQRKKLTPGFSRFSKPVAGKSAGAFSTPTKSSLARSSSVRTMKSTTRSFLPSLIKSPSMQSLAASASQTERKPSFTDKLSNLKSILRQPLIKVSNDPFKIAAGTHVSPEKATDVNTPTRPSPTKHVNFSPSPVEVFRFQAHSSSPATPSPAKKATPIATSPAISYPSLEGALAEIVTTPTAAIRSVAGNTTPGDFTFRPDSEIKFASPKPSAQTPTIRTVRASDTTQRTPLQSAPKLEHVPAVQTLADLPTVPHGLSNKKRKRESDEKGDEHDKENNEPADSPANKTKRARMTLGPSAGSTPTRGKGVASTSITTSPSKRIATPKRLKAARSVISLSRLNDLARPKEKK